jgi:S1-C subfamily serine protease
VFFVRLKETGDIEMKTTNPLFGITASLLFTQAVLVMVGCASTSEKRATDEHPKLTREQRRIAEKERKAAEDQKRWQQALASYSDEQLRFKLAGLNQAVERGREGMNIILAQGNGLAILIARGQFEAKVKERDAVGLEIARRDGTSHFGQVPRLDGNPSPDDGEREVRGSGTGFFITDDGFLVTNEHVVKDATKVRLVTGAGTIDAKVVQVDAANDLALLKADGKFSSLPIAASRTARLGNTVATIGFPVPYLQGFSPKLAKGEIASLSGIHDDTREFQISVPVQPGNSGGALVDEHGNVVGIVSYKLGRQAALALSGQLPENVNYAVKSSLLLSFLESVPEVSAKLKDPLSTERKFDDVVQSAQQATVLVLVY